MKNSSFDTLSEAVNALTKEGYTDDFQSEERCIKAIYSKNEYQPDALKIVQVFRFEGMTDPQDQSTLFAIEAKDGVKGTLVMSNSASHNHNLDLIQKIERL